MTAKERQQIDESVNLLASRRFNIEIPRQIDPHGVEIRPVSMGADGRQWATPLDSSVLPDNVMITDPLPAVAEMRLMNTRRRNIAVRYPHMMNDDSVRPRTHQKRTIKKEIRFDDAQSFVRCLVPHRIVDRVAAAEIDIRRKRRLILLRLPRDMRRRAMRTRLRRFPKCRRKA